MITVQGNEFLFSLSFPDLTKNIFDADEFPREDSVL